TQADLVEAALGCWFHLSPTETAEANTGPRCHRLGYRSDPTAIPSGWLTFRKLFQRGAELSHMLELKPGFRQLPRKGEYPRLEDMGLIGDGTTAALVSLDGGIPWLCLPRFA